VGANLSKLWISVLAVGLCAVSSVSPVQAQNPQGALNLFGAAMGAAVVQSVRAEWSRLPADELNCIQAAMAQQATSVERLIQSGIQPNDPRISRIRQACENILFRELRTNVECQMTTPAGQITSFCDEDYARNIGQGNFQRISKSDAAIAAGGSQTPLTALFERADAHSRREQMQMTTSNFTKVPSPNFNCAKAKTETELAVCRSYVLSTLDAEYGELYQRSIPFDRTGSMKREVHTIWATGNACEGETTCIERNLNHGSSSLAAFLRQNGQSVQTNAERREHERKQAEAVAAAQEARELQVAKERADEAAAERARQETERVRAETEQKITLEKFRAEQAQKAADAEIQRKKEQSEIEFRDLVHKTFGFAFPILGCLLLGTIFFVAIRRRAKQETESEEAKDNG
jgi:uncharacterized protein